MKNLLFPVGGGDEIGASCYFIQVDGEKILLDSGIRLHSTTTFPRFEALYNHSLIDGFWDLSAIFISHGHIDHIGSLPKVAEESPRVPIYTTLPTKQIMALQYQSLFRDSNKAHKDSIDFNVKLLQNISIERVFNNVVPKKWGESIKLGNCRITFFPAGHILGASMTYIESESNNILWTGDFSSFDQLTVPRYQLPANLNVDVLITETTYGYQDRANVDSIEVEREKFAKKIENVIQKNGTVLIPAFAIGRSQELALTCQFLIDKGQLPPIRVYIGGLSDSASNVYEENQIKVFSDHIQSAPRDLLRHLSSFSGVIIASSGMLVDFSTSARYAQKVLTDPNNALFFSGYLDEESPGKRILRLQRNHTIRLNHEQVKVKAAVDRYQLSAHTDLSGILELIEYVQPKKAIFVHGYPEYNQKTNIYREIVRKYGNELELHQSTNGVPIYF